LSSFNSVRAARGFSVSTTPDPARFLPGLDLANEVRQFYARGDNIAAIKLIRTALDVSLIDGAEWYRALTGWVPGFARQATKPEPDLGAIFDHVGDEMHALNGSAADLISDAFYRIAQEFRRIGN